MAVSRQFLIYTCLGHIQEKRKKPPMTFLRLLQLFLSLPLLILRPLSWYPGPVLTGKVGHRLKCATEGHDSSF